MLGLAAICSRITAQRFLTVVLGPPPGIPAGEGNHRGAAPPSARHHPSSSVRHHPSSSACHHPSSLGHHGRAMGCDEGCCLQSVPTDGRKAASCPPVSESHWSAQSLPADPLECNSRRLMPCRLTLSD